MLTLAEAALCLLSLAALGVAGWAFVNARLYREESERDAVAQARPTFVPEHATPRTHATHAVSRARRARPRAQCLFCATFALSVFLLLLILFDMTGALSADALRAAWRAALAALLACIMVATPFYLFYVALCADGARPAPRACVLGGCVCADAPRAPLLRRQGRARCAARWAPPPAWRPCCACSGRRATA